MSKSVCFLFLLIYLNIILNANRIEKLEKLEDSVTKIEKELQRYK